MLSRPAYAVFFTAPFIFAQSSTRSAEATLDRGIAEFHKGEYAEAQQDFERTLKLSPADARAITYLAVTQAALGDCSGTLDELNLQCHRNPDPEIRRLAGLAVIRCLLPHNRLGEIMPLLSQLRNSFPEDPDVLYESTQVYNRAWSIAVRDVYQKAANSYRANQVSAEILANQGKFNEAAAEYQKAIEKNPTALRVHYQLGVALLRAGHTAEARQAFEAELKMNASDAAAEYQIGVTFLAEQKGDEAAAHFGTALEIAPKFAEAMVALAKLKIDAQKYKDAIALLERAVELQPGMEAAHQNLMLAYRGAGKNKQADREQSELNKLKDRK